MMSQKKAATDYPIHELLADRWSPYAFESRPVSQADLCSLFEAARWSASSYNEQPWSYLVATQEQPDQFQQVLSCLDEANQVWAKDASVLALGIASLKFKLNDKDNRAAVHDLGAASSNLAIEAAARGIYVHQMIGILPDQARKLFHIPENFEAWTGLAIGYRGDPALLPDALKQRDLSPRQRKPLEQFVFSGKWGEASQLGSK
ncbi:MAG TPA: nitroreductase family protein [Leptolyngbya sp.]|jgi:nitroreductase|nr:nitroreductase family protein [Leptolyngbya sp.]